MDNVNLVHEEVIKMPYGKQRTGRTPVRKRKPAAKAGSTGQSGMKGGLMGQPKASRGRPAKQMKKRKPIGRGVIPHTRSRPKKPKAPRPGKRTWT